MSVLKMADFGAAKTGLATVGYQLYDSAGATVGSRVTEGVLEIGSTGIYAAAVDITGAVAIVWDTGEASPAYAGDEIEADVYHADVGFARDRGAAQDEYTVQWFKNGVPITTGITVPTIRVIQRADGTDLVAETAMTAVGATGVLKYDEATNRITLGEPAVVQVTATIDGAVRTWRRPVGRDS